MVLLLTVVKAPVHWCRIHCRTTWKTRMLAEILKLILILLLKAHIKRA